ncbi:hypothetical protein R1flu_013718 [Riccia fluitans]|uniref:Myotubularin phosphatase domain-containing protein n=1 Tax=Riccia fluitans TaxID=41844 RepID=A0ABD1YHR7_9MARC
MNFGCTLIEDWHVARRDREVRPESGGDILRGVHESCSCSRELGWRSSLVVVRCREELIENRAFPCRGRSEALTTTFFPSSICQGIAFSQEPSRGFGLSTYGHFQLTSSVKLAQNYEELLLPCEEITAEGRAVVLVNMDVAGTVLVTNYRLMFVGEDQKLVALGTIPLSTIEKYLKLVNKPTQQQPPRGSSSSFIRDRGPTRRLLQVVGKDMRNIVYGFRPRTKQRRSVFDALTRFLKSTRLWDLYAFNNDLPPAYKSGDSMSRLRAEYVRIISATGIKTDGPAKKPGLSRPSKSVREMRPEQSWWRISEVNANYTLCATYPSRLIVPSAVSDEEITQASMFRGRGRIPALCWRHGENGAVLARSAQPLIGFTMTSRSNADEKLVAALCPPLSNGSPQPRKLYIADARPRKNALANGALGGGSESSANYLQCEVVFLGIENIHIMRESFAKLRDYLDLHGGASSDGSSSLLRIGGWQWGGSNRSSMSAAVSALGDSGWLMHVHSILSSAAWIAGRLVLESASVLVHCSDGWDRTTQLISLAQLLLDPYYRTFRGFQALVEKDWISFGHPFADRLGTPTFTGGSHAVDGLGIYPNESTSPVRNGSNSAFSSSSSVAVHSPGGITSNYSPVFLQWADCVSQLLRLYPRAFEYSSAFLVDFIDCVLSCRFGNFLCNSEKERVQANISDTSGDMWPYLEKIRSAGKAQHEHYNILYDPTKHTGALLPPAAALSPILWPQLYLRWACPSGLSFEGCMPTGWGQGGDLENEARMWSRSFSTLQKAKERAEAKLLELQLARRALEEQLQNEKQHRTSLMSEAGQAQQESAALRRVLQTMGCKIRISKAKSGGNYSEGEVLYEDDYDESESLSRDEYDADRKRNEPLAVSVTFEGDQTAFHVRRSCGVDGALSCSGSHEGDVCTWPQSGCARMGSAFVGLKADFNALEQLSILDCYFAPDLQGSASSGDATASQSPGVT